MSMDIIELLDKLGYEAEKRDNVVLIIDDPYRLRAEDLRSPGPELVRDKPWLAFQDRWGR